MKKPPASAFLTLAMLTMTQYGFSLPIDPQVLNGQTGIEQAQNLLNITASDKAIINWGNFSIQPNEQVNFILPDTTSAVLNRDMGSLPSHLMGTLISNGQVYVINPRGIIIGQNAYINTAGFIASTLDVLNADFLKGSSLLFKGEKAGSIVQLGTIRASVGDVVLVGKQVTNQGTIEAKNGTVAIAEGFEVLLQTQGNERIFVRPSSNLVKEDGTGIDLQGTVQALEVELQADGNLYEMAIKTSGKIEALTTVEKEGRIFLVADQGKIEASGVMEAPGGTVRILGDNLAVSGQVDVSSDSKGGTILVGGDFQGKNPDILNATQTIVSQDALLKADAIQNGNGGKVIVWADGLTSFTGNISAKGGAKTGDGGLVEVSGKMQLDYRGYVSTHAPYGKTGTLLLDPVNVRLSTATTSSNESLSGGTYAPTGCSPSPANIRISELITALDANNIIVTTAQTSGSCTDQGTITVASAINYRGTSSNSLTLTAASDIYVESPITLAPTTGTSGALTLTAGGAISIDTGANLTTHAATPTNTNGIVLTAVNNIYVGANVQNLGTSGVSATSSSGSILVGTLNTSEVPGSPSATPALQKVFIGSQLGTTSVTANLDVLVGDPNLPSMAGLEYSFPSQIGWGGAITTDTAVGGAISVSASRNVIVHAGNGDDRAFAQIGHGNASSGFDTISTFYGTLSSANISVFAANNVTVEGGTGPSQSNPPNGIRECFAQIGHGGIDINNMTNPIYGDITVLAENALLVQGGLGEQVAYTSGGDLQCYAQIGHLGGGPVEGTLNCQGCVEVGSSTDVNGNIYIGKAIHTSGDTATATVSVLGGTSHRAWGHIGHGGDNLTVTGNITGQIQIGTSTLPIQTSVLINGGSGDSCWAQVGHGGGGGYSSGAVVNESVFTQNLTGNITIAEAADAVLHVYGNTAEVGYGVSYAQIGHGGFGAQEGTSLSSENGGWGGNIQISGPTQIETLSVIDVKAGNAFSNYAQIGHGGAYSAPSFIGAHNGSSYATANIFIEVDTLTLTAASGSTTSGDGLANAYAQIGHGGSLTSPAAYLPDAAMTNFPQTGQYIGNITISAQAGEISVTGITLSTATDGVNAPAQIGHGGSGMVLTRPSGSTLYPSWGLFGAINLTVVHENLALVAGNGPSSTDAQGGAWIGHGYAPSGNTHPFFIGDSVNYPSEPASLTINVPNSSITLDGGTAGSDGIRAIIGNGNIVTNNDTTYFGNQTITAASITARGGSGDQADAGIVAHGLLQTITTSGDTTIRGETTTIVPQTAFGYVANLNPSGQTNITSTGGNIYFLNGNSAQYNGAFLQSVDGSTFSGAGVSLTAAGDISLAQNLTTASSGAISINATGAFYANTATYSSNTLGHAGAYGITLTSASGNISIISSPTFSTLGNYSGDAADFQIGASNDLSEQNASHAFMTTGFVPVSLVSTSGNITVNHYTNIFGTSGVVTTGGTVLLIANNNGTFQYNTENFGSPINITGTSGVTIVVDNQAPAPNAIGTGSFTLADDGSTISAGTSPALRIFSARQPQNSITGSLNGTAYVAGTEFLNSSTEHWGVWYNFTGSSYSHYNYVVFYKDSLPLPVFSTNFISNPQLFTYVHAWESYLNWDTNFSVAYDTGQYLDQQPGTAVQWSTLFQPYTNASTVQIAWPEKGRLQTNASYLVVPSQKFLIPPRWRSDGRQYNQVLY